MRLVRRDRLSTRQLSAALAVVGILGGLAFLVVPVEAAFADHPLLRLHPFSPALERAATEVDCGVPVRNLGRRPDGVSLYGLARADACRDAAGRRAATGVAAAAVTGVLGLLGRVGARSQPVLA